MHSRSPKDRRRAAAIVLLFSLLGVLASLAACKSELAPAAGESYAATGAGGAGSDGGGCAPGREGCECSDPGQVVDCGRVHATEGSYVSCSMGHSTCIGGKWGQCTGDHLVWKSLPGLELGLNGLKMQANASECTNVCDPYCASVVANQKDVDASGFQPVADGGVTLVADGSVTLQGDASTCIGLQCQIETCSPGITTTLSGTVYDPAGKTPLTNATVYVPIYKNLGLPALSEGASCDVCAGSSLAALQVAQTDAAGTFLLTNVPSGSGIPVVVQLGKWRREIVLKNVVSCAGNTVTNNCTEANQADCIFRLPKNHKDGYDPIAGTYTKGDMPHVAIVTGSADPFDCLLLKAGIDASEFGDYTSNRRFHFYEADTKPGHTLDPAYGMNVKGSTLWNSLQGGQPSMMDYDALLLPCEGGATDKQGSSGTNTPYQNLIDYTNAGGRAFATHFSYSWLQFPAGKKYVTGDNWSGVANWSPTGVAMTGSINTQDPLTGTVDTSFPKGALYSQWLQNVSATTVPTKLTIHEGRQDLTTIGSTTQQWMSANDTKYAPAPIYSNLFTFNTPYGAPSANQCGRVVFSDFHVSANANVGSSKCLADVDCGFGATCNGETSGAVGQCNEPCQTPSDCPNTGYACNGAAPGACQAITCKTAADCGTGRSCVGGQCTCTGDADCNGGSCGGKFCSAISCTSSAQCGNGTCAGGTCNSVACHANADCGAGTCGGVGKYGTCAAGTSCHTDSECGPTGTCGSGTSSVAGTCGTNTQPCHANADCDSNTCGTGTSAVKGTCATNGKACHANTECDSSACGSGTGSAVGTCTVPAGTACHVAADCDSTCGSGTGAVAGTCSTGGTACHVAGDCDSALCGSGTGAVVGSCSTGGIACHVAGDCDSALCGSGTGAVAGSCSTGNAACHANADCDSNSCGAGALAGTCGSSSQTCHTNAQCDSGACGTGASGSAKGVCTAGACTTNAQCGTGGSCVGNKCVAGACSLDTNCGTAGGGGVCTGATCTTKSCAADSICGVSHTCNGAKCSAKACAGDTACGVGHSCNGATCATKACAGDTACGVGHSCNGATCATKACAGDTACGVGHSCNGATCAAPTTCTSDAACTKSKTCTGAKCGNATTCAGDIGCSVSKTCNGATCGTKSCAGDAGCGASHTCNGAKCSKSSCSNDGECPSGILCAGAKCTPPANCGSNAECGTGGACSSAKCTTPACNTNADCGAGSVCGGSCSVAACTKDSDCPSGLCRNGTCGCATDEACGGSQTCVGESAGTCGRSCSTDAECAPDRCVNGQCGGCTDSSSCHDSTYTPSCGGIPSGNYGTCSSSTPGVFPGACKQGDLSAQEKALEFMFFDLTACVSADNKPPPPPPVVLPAYKPATFIQDFTATCIKGFSPQWREFDWQAQIEGDSNIQFFAQTGDTVDTLNPANPILVSTAKKSTDVGTGNNYDFSYIDTANAAGAGGVGAFNIATPAVRSKTILRMTITVNPTTDLLQAPTLRAWKVQYDCVPNE